MNRRYTNNLLGALALAVTDRVEDSLEHELGAGGNVSPALMSIGTRPGESIDQLARVLGLSHSAAVRLVHRLDDRGWVRRRRGGEDGRTVLLSLTRSGTSAFQRLLNARDETIEGVIDGLTRQEHTTLCDLLTKLLGAIPGSREEARHVCRLCEHSICRGARCPVGSAV